MKDNFFSNKNKNNFDLDFLKPNFLNDFKLFNNDSNNKIDFNYFSQNKIINNIKNLKNQNNSFICPAYNSKTNINQDKMLKINSDVFNNTEEINTNINNNIRNNIIYNKTDIENIIKKNKGSNNILNNEQIVNKKNNGFFNLEWPKYYNNINFNINTNKNYLFPPIDQLSILFQNKTNYLINPINSVLNDTKKYNSCE